MPVGRKSTSALAITLTDHQGHIYQPGDTLNGIVSRSAHVIAPDCRVTIRLLGCTKTTVVVRNSDTTTDGDGNTRTTYWHDAYRSCFNFFGEETAQVLFSGAMHIAPEGDDRMEFPFALTIPTRPSSRLASGAGSSRLPMHVASLAQQELPPTHSACDASNSGVVEYWLEAEFTPGPGTQNRSIKEEHATQPIYLGARPTPEHVPKVVKTLHSSPYYITSYKLIPEMKDVELTFKQKSKQFFHTRSVPCLAYRVSVGIPTVIQLNGRETFPLTLRVSPMEDKSSASLRGMKHKATINSIVMELKRCTSISARGHGSGTTTTTDLQLERAFQNMPALPMEVDVDPDGERIDLGALFDLRLSKLGLRSGTERLTITLTDGPITPTFETYNLSVKHALKVTISVTVCGKEHQDSFKFDTCIKPPPELPASATSQPGPSSELALPPPSFEEAMRQPSYEGERPPGYGQVSPATTQVQS